MAATMNVRALLTGSFDVDTLPPEPSKLVRVYVCSTATDTVEERHALASRVGPQLRQYCRETYGLEFQFIDLHFGVEGDWSNACSERSLALEEIEDCHRISVGPSFIALIGQKYGHVPLPNKIWASDFELIRNTLVRHNGRDTRDAPLLDTWYKLDNYAVPPVYVLQTVDEVKPRPPSSIQRLVFNIADGTFSWPKTRALLQWLLKRGIELCVLQDSFSPESDCTQYLMSDLEREIDAGIVQSDDPAAGCVVFVRHIIDLKNYLDEPTASRFAELQYNPVEGRHEFDDEAGRCLDALRCEKIDPLLSAENIHTFDVLWRFDNGICATQHSNYLEDFCRRMRAELQQMVDDAAQAQCECSELPPFIDDVYHHWMLVKRKSEVFYGREELLEVVRSYVRSNDTMPLIIHGEFGCGKGSLIAKSVCQMPYWIVGELVTVVRYVGATRRSADIKQILYGICQQLNLVLGVDTGDIPMTWRGLRPYFVRLLSTFPSDKNLVVMLADLDRLPDDQHNAHALEWLPASLNENVKLVLATSDELPHMASARLRESLLRFENNIVRLLHEPTETCVEVLEQMLVKDGRRLTEEQRAIIEDALHECPLPLYMRFLLTDAVDWTPNTIPSLPADVAGYVEEIFGRLERRHGAVTVAHALAYMSASETGVSDAEMDDLLSLDDAVLAEVYGARQPTVRRVPPTVWLRLKVDISYFLRRCNYDGVSVSCWDRREFADAVAKRFMSGARTRRDTHSAMADYYLGTWSDVAKPYAAATPLSSAGPHRRRLVEQTPPPTARYAALRYVPHQPLILGRCSDGSTIYNLRKLRQLPTHLLAAGRLTELNERVLFNYDWLHSKICAISLQSAIDDLALGGACVDAILVRTALLDAQSFVEVDVDSLASELSGRLLSYYSTHSNVARLVRQCDTIGSRCCGIVPAFPYHQVPGGPLKNRLECPGRPTTFALVGDAARRRVLAKDPHTAVVTAFNIETGERLPDVDTSAGDMHVSPNGRYLVMVDGAERKSIKVHDALTGAFTGHLIPMKHVHLRPKQKYAMVRICVSDMNVCALVTTEASFVCIAALDSCSMRHVIGLNGRSTLCDITPDGRHLFVNDAYQVIVYDLQTLERISAAPFERRPRNITFTRDATRALLLDESDDNRIVVLLLKDGRIEFSFKIALGDALYDDHVRHVCTSHVRDMVLVRGAENLLVYNIVSEQTMRHFRRPKKLPEEIRLPRSSSYAPVEFKHALFSADDRLVIAAIFRSVYVWSIDSDDDIPVATLQTPLGIIDQLFVSPDDVNIVTHTSGSSGVDVWSLDSAIGRISSIDSLTAPVAEIRLPDDDSVAFVRCTGSDELGIIDMRTGKLVDLLTHESPLQSFAITTDAEYALVTLKWSHVDLVNKIWHVTGRRVIYEFGAVGAHTVALRDSIAIVAVYQEQASFHAPYHVTLFRFADGSFDEYRLEPTLPFVLSAPFVTPDDKFLVALSATSYDERIGDYVEPTIVAVALNGPISMRTYGNDDMRDVVRMRRILHIRPYPKAIYAILVLFTKERRPTPERRRYDHCYDFMIFDVYNGVVCELIENFLTPSTSLERVLFPTDVSICVDDQSHVFDMRSGAYVKRIAGAPPSPPRCLALDGRVAMYADRRHLHAVRIADDRCIARVDVHADIECVFVGHDARTVVVGCRDGTVVAYVLVDADAEDVTEILLAIRSRVCRPPSAADADDDCRRLRHRSWDKVDACDRTPSSRPPSAAVHKGPSDREVLSKVKLLERELFVPNNLWYRNRSKACSIM